MIPQLDVAKAKREIPLTEFCSWLSFRGLTAPKLGWDRARNQAVISVHDSVEGKRVDLTLDQLVTGMLVDIY